MSQKAGLRATAMSSPDAWFACKTDINQIAGL
jgi:hypothetical protein